MKFVTKIILTTLLSIVALNGHEHWLFTDAPSYKVGESIAIHLQSGHVLGDSEFLISTRLIREAFVITPSGEDTSFVFEVNGNEHIYVFKADKPGQYTVLVNLRKRNKGQFTHLLKTTFLVGNTPYDTQKSKNQELEIVFGDSSHSLRVLTNGEAVNVPIKLMTEDQIDRSLIMNRKGISVFASESPGFHVAVCHFRRQAASFSFYSLE